MKPIKSIFNVVASLAINFILALVFFVAVSQFADINPLSFAAITVLSGLAIALVANFAGYSNNVKGFAFMALQTEVWIKDIQENLYMENDFLKYATNDSVWVNNKTVHVPQAGSAPGVEKNRSSLPASIAGRTDTELTYDISSYTTDPQVIQRFEEVQLSYDKRNSILMNMMEAIRFTFAQQILYSWAPSGATRQVRTSGSTSTLNLPNSTATGSRKMITVADITALKQILDNDRIPKKGRVLLVPDYMYNTDILNISGIVQAYSFGAPVMPEGVVARLMGFDIITRPEVLTYDNTGTPVIKAISGDGTVTTPATSDNGAAIAYHPNYVSYAVGQIIPYQNSGSNGNGLPEYYGSIFSAELWGGGAKRRTDQKGVAVLVQSA